MFQIHNFWRFVLGKNKRTYRANKHIIYSLLIKGISILSQFALVPITLNYLDKFQYGIWLTLASILGWFSFFDVGIGNGLRNKLSEALAKNDIKLAKTYVSTSYAIVSIIFLSIIIIFWLINPLISWVSILNVPDELQFELSKMVLFVFTFFSLRFIFILIGKVTFAYQEPALNNLIGPLGNIFSLVFIYILTITTEGSLLIVGIIFSLVPLVLILIFNVLLFKSKYKEVAPNLNFIDLRYSNQLFGLGIQFFIIQIASMTLFTTTNIILIRLFGPEDVTVFNIAYKYLTISLLIINIFITPYWSAITEAFINNEIKWIKKSIRRLEYLAFLLILMTIVMILFADYMYIFWVGNKIKVPLSLNIAIGIFVIVNLLSAPFNTFINGVGKIRLQTYLSVVSIIITIPLAILFSKTLNFGPAGVVYATICTTLPTMIIWRIQYRKLLYNRARGIWNK